MKENNVRKYIIVILLMLVVLVSGTTYALFTKSVNTKGTVTLKSGTRYIGIYDPDKENIGLNVTYTLTIENRGVEDASYQVTLEDIINTVGRENINYTYTNGETTKTGKLSDGIIEEENLGVGEKVTVTIRLTSDLSGDYKGKIKVTTGEPVKKNCIADLDSVGEDTSGANPPELVGDMIPVVYNECTKSWVKADTTKSWYNYDNQVWANAVTIKDQAKRARYVSATAGTEIPIDDMNTMMVWIPRYSYTLGNTYGYKIEGASEPSVETPGAFDIKFVDKNITEMGSGKYTGDIPVEYFTPSSFCWGDTCDNEATRKDAGNIELSGIWISKFKISGTKNDILSLPNKNPLVNQNISSLFTNIKNSFNGENGITNYGLNGNYDAHMIKNTELGAFIYLSQSKYGKYGNKNYTNDDKKIFYNSSSESITGCGGSRNGGSFVVGCPEDYKYNKYGIYSNTTGTIYGIYDVVSSGVYEYVMGNYKNYSGSNSNYNSGFNGLYASGGSKTDGIGFPSRKYYNLYIEGKGIKGDVTNADGTSGFYGGSTDFINSDYYTWFARGRSMFGYSGGTGGTNEKISTRFNIVTW